MLFSPAGESAVLKCTMYGVPLPSVTWEARGRNLGNLTLMSFGKQMTLIKEIIGDTASATGSSKSSSVGFDHGESTSGSNYGFYGGSKHGKSMLVGDDPQPVRDEPHSAAYHSSHAGNNKNKWQKTTVLNIMNALPKDSAR